MAQQLITNTKTRKNDAIYNNQTTVYNVQTTSATPIVRAVWQGLELVVIPPIH
jgi:hypothetical protein